MNVLKVPRGYLRVPLRATAPDLHVSVLTSNSIYKVITLYYITDSDFQVFMWQLLGNIFSEAKEE